MTALALTAAPIALLAALLVPLIRADVRRAVRRRRVREIRRVVEALRGRGVVRLPSEAHRIGPVSDYSGAMDTGTTETTTGAQIGAQRIEGER